MPTGWPVSLRHGRIGVRPLARRDAARWARLRADNAEWLSQWEATMPPGGGSAPPTFSALIAHLRRRAREGRGMPFAVTWDGQMVGQLTVSNITLGSARWAAMGYWIAKSHAGRGITATAVALVCDHLFDTVGLHRVEISIRPENTASLRIVEKLGFTEIGLAPDFLHIDGAWRDHRIFQLLDDAHPGGVLAYLESVRKPTDT